MALCCLASVTQKGNQGDSDRHSLQREGWLCLFVWLISNDRLDSDIAACLCRTLLTEEVAKFEPKYRDSHFSASFHNFFSASNHAAEQLLKMSEGDRRYVLIN